MTPPTIATKYCRDCEKDKPTTSFFGRNTICKDCRNHKRNMQRFTEKIPYMIQHPLFPETKYCAYCKSNQPLDLFGSNAYQDNGKQSYCNPCRSKYYLANPNVNHRVQVIDGRKQCTICKIEKHVTDFYKVPTISHGYGSHCKKCRSNRTKEYHSRPHVKLHRSKIGKRYYSSNREKIREYGRMYSQKNKERISERMARWNAQPEVKQRQKQLTEAWAKANHLKRKESDMRRRARKNGNSVERINYTRILERDGMHCHICNTAILEHHILNFDHVIPLSRQGTHTEDNIKPSHSTCNFRKGTHLLSEMTDFQRRGIDETYVSAIPQFMK